MEVLLHIMYILEREGPSKNFESSQNFKLKFDFFKYERKLNFERYIKTKD